VYRICCAIGRKRETKPLVSQNGCELLGVNGVFILYFHLALSRSLACPRGLRLMLVAIGQGVSMHWATRFENDSHHRNCLALF